MSQRFDPVSDHDFVQSSPQARPHAAAPRAWQSKLRLPNLWLIVPVKRFGEGKSRLAATLDRAQRDALSRRWLATVLTTAQAWGGFAGMAVISHDPAVWTLAQSLGALAVEETGEGLNPALEQARAAVMAAGAEAVLVLPSDLPLLTVADLAELGDLAQEGKGVVIAPSRDGGTNALLLRPPDAIPYGFGAASFARHLAFAQAAGLSYRVYHSSTLALDMDYPEDLVAAGVEVGNAGDNRVDEPVGDPLADPCGD